ncbi:MAG: hypothetical protein ABF805_08920 [Bifidobacterium sp.]
MAMAAYIARMDIAKIVRSENDAEHLIGIAIAHPDATDMLLPHRSLGAWAEVLNAAWR